MFVYYLTKPQIANELVLVDQRDNIIWRGTNKQLDTRYFDLVVKKISARGVYLYITVY